jgi:hypothetical protein
MARAARPVGRGGMARGAMLRSAPAKGCGTLQGTLPAAADGMSDRPGSDEPHWAGLGTPAALYAAIEELLQTRHGSPRTAEAYVRWVRRFTAFSGRRHPKELGPKDVEAFLSSLATKENVSASTQNQALAALLFLYKEVLGAPLGYFDGVVHAKRPKRLPVVLLREKSGACSHSSGRPGSSWRIFSTVPGSG